ncbi:MAG: type I-U CRISPR-associated protein Csx17 [Deltaproteobacteria bacterium]|nr:type I-U CRISPR-associated protein Csx17 [Deltaproteobacteria bacterium]
MNTIKFDGIKSSPLSSYLKALAVFRILHKQKDSNITAYWKERIFHVNTVLNTSEIIDFFLEEYRPSPVCSPWNGGSGFFAVKKGSGLDRLRNSKLPRYENYSESIKIIDSCLINLKTKYDYKDLSSLKKDLDKLKPELITTLRGIMPDGYIAWMNTSVAFSTDGSKLFNILLGTGGNDGNMEFSTNFMNNISDILPDLNAKGNSSQKLLKNSLFSNFTQSLVGSSIGQYDPFSCGGYNQGQGIETKSVKINPWDYIFIIEGSLVHTASVVRRNEYDNQRNVLSIPFGVTASNHGYPSRAEEKSRGELWLPLWETPVYFSELSHIFSEGRVSKGRKKSEDGTDFLRAISTLGVDRGFTEFTRFSFLERRGNSYNAQDIGSFPVRINTDVNLLDEVDSIISKYQNFLNKFHEIPASFNRAFREIGDNLFNTAAWPEKPGAFINLLRSLGKMERLIAPRDKEKPPEFYSPANGLSPSWIKKAGMQILEVRLAAAIASIQNSGKVGTMRTNLSGTSPFSNSKWAEKEFKNQKCLLKSNIYNTLATVFMRRILDSVRFENISISLNSKLEVSVSDVMAFMLNDIDTELLYDLIFAFNLINWKREEYSEIINSINSEFLKYQSDLFYQREWCLMKSVYTPSLTGHAVKLDPQPAKLLHSGRYKKAWQAAVHRLKVSQINVFDVDYENSVASDRIIASLIIPVKHDKKIIQKISKPNKNKEKK